MTIYASSIQYLKIWIVGRLGSCFRGQFYCKGVPAGVAVRTQSTAIDVITTGISTSMSTGISTGMSTGNGSINVVVMFNHFVMSLYFIPQSI